MDIKKSKKKKTDFTWVRYIRDRTLNKNKNFICSITGPTGSGKTYCSLSIGEMVDPEFNSERVVFKAKDLMNLINSGKLKSGSVIIWDEAGIDLSSRNWQSQLNKVINFLLQTFRHRNFVLIFTMPYADFVDSASRKLFHAEFETVSINRTKKTCSVKPKMLQYNAAMKKWYRKYLKVVRQEGGMVKVKRWAVPKPSKQLIKEYEANKMEFTKDLNKEIEESIKKLDKGENEKKKPTEKQQEVLDFWKKGIFSQKDIAKELGVTITSINERVKYLRKKGYNEDDYRKKGDKV